VRGLRQLREPDGLHELRAGAGAPLTDARAEATGAAMPLAEPVRAQIESLVSQKPVVLFMKGNRQFPQCGFSAQVVQILDEVAGTYDTVNVLADPSMRDGIKEYSSWPTIPQLYVRGQFVGGCDIVKEMYASGELQKLLGDGAPSAPPRLTVSARAAAEIGKAAADTPGEMLRLAIGPSFDNELYFDAPTEGDFRVDCGALVLLVDKGSARRADGVAIDFTEGPAGAGFKIDNPNEPPRVKPIQAPALKAMLDAGSIELFDVRPEDERKMASIVQAKPLDGEGQMLLSTLDKSTPIALHCHHGMRSRAAGEQLLRAGFTNVYNLEGGIEAWSRDVDASVSRY
jgi:monothiol glutaredoxin